jgi:L-seryl-tRNA(Ser) seleniumtransferase
MPLAALDWTTRVMLEGRAFESIPVLRMLTTPVDQIRRKAERLASALAAKGFKTSVEPRTGRVGGGSLPEVELEGVVVSVEPPGSASALARSLREGEPPLLVRVQEGAVLLDPRTLEEADLDTAAAAFGALV